MKKSGDSSTLTRTPFLGNTEETRKHIQPTGGPTHQADSLKELERIFLTRTSMRKFGVSSTLTRTPFHGNIEETRKLIQQTDGPTHQADSLKELERTSLTKTLMKKSGDS